MKFNFERWGETILGAIVAVVAESEAAARLGASRVRVTYDDLPAVLDVDEALRPGAPVVRNTRLPPCPGSYSG